MPRAVPQGRIWGFRFGVEGLGDWNVRFMVEGLGTSGDLTARKVQSKPMKH